MNDDDGLKHASGEVAVAHRDDLIDAMLTELREGYVYPDVAKAMEGSDSPPSA